MFANAGPFSASLGLALLVAVRTSQGSSVPLKRCPEPTKQAIAHLFDRWNASLATGDPNAVAKLYADNAALLPALSDRLLVGREQIRGHFAHFLARHPQASVTTRTIKIDCATEVDTGTCVYRVTGRRKGTRMLIGGRYAIRYAFQNGEWRIIGHRAVGEYRRLSLAGDLTTTEINMPAGPISDRVAATSTVDADKN
jgi:uncharacterized protein (TIGR02246 family)